MATEPAANPDATAGTSARPAPLVPPVSGDAFPSALQWRPDTINYAAHPAYREDVGRAPVATRAKAAAFFARKFAQVLAKRLIRYEMIPLHARQQGGSALCREAVRNLLTSGRRADRGKPVTSDVTRNFFRDGVAAISLAPTDHERVRAAAAGQFARLQCRRGVSGNAPRAFDESRATASRLDSGPLYDTVEAALEAAGVMQTARDYLGREVRLVDINPQINDPSDSFWREIFPDLALDGMPPAAYFHRDASGGDLKAIIYMTDVGEQNGPFSYVVGSHRLKINRLDDWICEANDHGLSDTAPERRAMFAALPRKLRQKCAFGNDLQVGDPMLAEIARATWEIEAPAGSIVLFDTKGIHRGGMVEAGERRVLTCILG